MSLTNALLLDEYRDPLEHWIALRSDGAKGSGTQADPWNGGVSLEPAGSVTLSSSGSIATAVRANHSYVENDVVTIVGAADTLFNGTFRIFGVQTDSFQYAMPDTPSGGASGNPTAARVVYLFDLLMRDVVPANALVHLGVGVFETRGFDSARQQGWSCKPGQKIRGCGMGLTATLAMGHQSELQTMVAIIGPNISFAGLLCAKTLSGSSRASRMRTFWVFSFGAMRTCWPKETSSICSIHILFRA